MRIGVLLCLCLITSVAGAQLKFNEISANKGVVDEDGTDVDWLELINYSPGIINVSGYHLSDDANDLTKWTIPSDEVNPQQLYPLFASGKDKTTRIKHWESVVNAENTWNYISPTEEIPGWQNNGFDDSSWSSGPGGIGFGDADDGTSIPNTLVVYARHTFTINTLDNINALVFHADYDDAYVAYLNGIEISRSFNINGSPPAFDAEATELHEAELYQGGAADQLIIPEEFIDLLIFPGENVLAFEVHNESAFSSDMSGNFFLSVGINDDTFSYQPTPSWFNPGPSLYHTNFKVSAGETLYLSDPDGVLLDEITLDPSLANGITQGRSPDGTDNWCVFDTPTPGTTNGNSWCYDGIEPPPTVSLASGWYNGMQNVYITPGSETQTVRYSRNGDYPTIDAPVNTGSLAYLESGVLAVRGFSTGNSLPSPVVDRTFIIGEDNHDLAVFSVHTDSLNLWDWNTGIYVFGPNAGPDYPYFGSNFWEPWSKWSRLEYFDENQLLKAEAQFDLEIHGGWSRAEPQKSFRFDFKSEYTGRLDHPVINDKPYIQQFNNLNVRNGGQHVWSDKIQDAFIGRLIQDTHVDNMGYEACLVYLNGEFWGVYGIREKFDEHYIEDNHGVPSESVDLMNSFTVLAGSSGHWQETVDLLMNMDSNSSDFYAAADARLDLKNYIDYFTIETYCQNVDWLGIAWGANNIKLWHPQTPDGKWRYMLYDMDGSMGYFGSQPWQNYIAFARDPAVPNDHSNLFDHMLGNPQFMHEFVNRYADIMNTLFVAAPFYDVLDAMEEDLEAAMPDHIDRWGAPGSMNEWHNAVDEIVNFNSLRLGYARSFVNQEFDLDGQREIVLDVDPPGAGRIHISTIEPQEYPWQGVYYDGCPVVMTAIPNPGYAFDHWDPNLHFASEQSDQEVNVNFEEDDTFTAVFSGTAQSVSIKISEICYNPNDNLDSGEWLELFNDSDFDLDVSSYKVFDQFDQYEFQIPVGTVIPAGDYLVIAADITKFGNIHPTVNNVVSESGFSLGNEGDIINVVAPDGTYVISLNYDDAPAWPQGADGLGRTLEYVGLGNQNSAASWFDGCIGGSPGEAYSPCEEPIVFSEINYHGLESIDPGDWIELWNVSDDDVDLSGWKLQNSFNSGSYTFTEGTILASDERVVICQNLAAFESVYACFDLAFYLGEFNFALDNGGEDIELLGPDLLLRNAMMYDDSGSWPTDADGLGFTLELVDPEGSPAAWDNWATGCPQGSPTQPFDPDCFQGLTVSISEEGNTLTATVQGGDPDYAFVWTLDGNPVGDGTTLSTVQSGQYVVTVTDGNGCAVSSEVFDFTYVHVEDHSISGLEIYPVPVTDQMQLVGELYGQIALRSADGKLVYEGQKTGPIHVVDVQNLAPGIYTLGISLTNGWKHQKVLIH